MDLVTKRQALYFSKFLSLHLGFNVNLILDLRPNAHDQQSTSFIIWGEQGELTNEEQQKLVFWCLHAKPQWVDNWWEARETRINAIERDKSGYFVINATDLGHMIFALDPRRENIMKQIAADLNIRYLMNMRLVSYRDEFFLANEHCDSEFLDKIKKDIAQNIGLTVFLSTGAFTRLSTLCVSSLTPSRLLSFDKSNMSTPLSDEISPDEAVKMGFNGPILNDCRVNVHLHRGQKFISQYKNVLSSQALIFNINTLNILLKLNEKPLLEYLPTPSDLKCAVTQPSKSQRPNWMPSAEDSSHNLNDEIERVMKNSLFHQIDHGWYEYLKRQERAETPRSNFVAKL